MRYEEWLETVPGEITGDSLWKTKLYRLALFAADLGWQNVSRLASERRTMAVADQMHRSVGSIGANLAEGYSRGSSRDRARFYEYALGSARESRDWYYRARHVLKEIIRLLLAMVPQQRGRVIRENQPSYTTVPEQDPEPPASAADLTPRWRMLLSPSPTTSARLTF